jgi:hypothetical protein
MRFGIVFVAAQLMLLAQGHAAVASPATSGPSIRSATKARDINGFALGMHINDAREIAPVKYIGGDQFETQTGGVSYNFGVTPAGRIYRVQSSQPLGSFTVDSTFLARLSAKLIAKYGPATTPEAGNYGWDLIETVSSAEGFKYPFKTNWFGAYISGGGDDGEVGLEMTMIDFRILWADRAKLNKKPRAAGEDRIRF